MIDPLEFLTELVSIPSPSGEEAAVARYLARRMAALGYRVRRDEAGNVVGELGSPNAERSILLLGHMDTVPGHIPVQRVDGRLYGRGSVDAKGPLAAFVLAAARVAPHLKSARVLVAGTVEEEVHGRGARFLARTMAPPWCAVIGEPSHWEGVTLGYKGVLSLDYHLVQPGAHRASEISSPAEKAVLFWNRLVSYAAKVNGKSTGRFSTLDPALREIKTFSDGLNDGVEMGLSVRLPPGIRSIELEEIMRAWSDGARLIFHPSDPPFKVEKNTPVVRAMLRAIRSAGGKPRFKLKTGTSDMNVVGPAWGCPMAAYGPGDSSLDHTPDEHVEIAEFHRAVDVVSGVLEILAGQ